jgi:hypothetical protein
MFKQICITITIAIFGVGLGLLINQAIELNLFTTFPHHGGEHCTRIVADGAYGMEDGSTLGKIVVFTADGSRRDWLMHGSASKKEMMSDPKKFGHLFAYVNGALKRITRVREPDGFNFHPHGMALQRAKSNDKVRIYVVNHQPTFEEVVVYNYDEEKNVAEYIDSVRDRSLFRSINDVTAVSENEIYVSDWRYYEEGTFMSAVEMLGRFKWTYLTRCVKKQDIGWDCKIVSVVVVADWCD